MAYTTVDDPSAFFHVQTYTGTGANQDVVNTAHSGNFKPDLLIVKRRDGGSYGTNWYDSSRGVKRYFYSDQAYGDDLEQYNADGSSSVQLFNTNGFRGGSSTNIYAVYWINGLNATYVAWQWQVSGGTTASNSVGNISSTVQANTTSGCSIVTYTGNGSANQTIGHGLGAVPKMVLYKNRSTDSYWYVYHVGTGNDTMTYLNLTNAAQSLSSQFSTPTTTTFNVSNENSTFGGYNTNGDTYVAYVFADVQGFSKFSKYTGNGNANGVFVYLGFKPEFVMVKRTDSTNDWIITDNARGVNGANPRLYMNKTDSEGSAADYIDHLSNGFKIRTSAASMNASGGTYIYMAFAENPFVTSTSIPTTAR